MTTIQGPVALASYACDFCHAPGINACFACGKRFCELHGHYKGGMDTKSPLLCGECYYLRLYGETYQLQIAGNYVVESIDKVEDAELAQLLSFYERKVNELETLIASARRQSSLLKNRLKLTRTPSAQGTLTGAPSKRSAKASEEPVDLASLAKQIAASGLDINDLLAKLQGGQKK